MNIPGRDGYDVIVGAGISGLTAADGLARSGRRCLLIEKEGFIGGLARSLEFDGITFDLGPHVLYENDRSRGAELLREVLCDSETITGPFRYAIMSGGRAYKMPIMFDFLTYPIRYKLEIASSMIKRPAGGIDPASIRHSIESKFGASFYNDVFGPMVRKKTGIRGGDLHSEWFIRPPRDVLNRKKPRPSMGLRRFLNPLRNFFSSKRFVYPVKGFGQYADCLHRRYIAAGGETILDCGGLSLSLSENAVTGITVRGTAYPVRNLLWTGSVNDLNALLGSGGVREDYVKLHIVFLTYDAKPGVGHRFIYTYHPQDDIVFVRAYYPHNIYGGRGVGGRAGICLEVTGGANVDNMSGEEMVAACVRDVERIGMFPASSLRQSKAVTLREGMPVYRIDYERTMAKLFEPARKYENVFSVGRTGGYYFCMTPAAVEQGIEAAEFMLASGREADAVDKTSITGGSRPEENC